MALGERKYFVVKHDLESFLALPHYIWRTGKPASESPFRFDLVRAGDRWVSFAFIDNERDRGRISQIVWFSECVRAKWHGPIPKGGLAISGGETRGWLIQGEAFGEQPTAPADVPPIAAILGKGVFQQAAIIPIAAEDFDRMRGAAFSRSRL